MVDGLGGAHRVLIQQVRLCLLGGLGGGARARDQDGDLVGKLLKLACVVEAIAGHYAFYPGRVDAATVDGEQVKARPGDRPVAIRATTSEPAVTSPAAANRRS
jgi:hypothetical protein